jgi:two-component system chemotaxis response regulator CheY
VARLLVVDDDESDRVVLRTILERAKHEVFEAKDGAEALSQFQGHGIEVVITDLQMDNVHGLELITILRDLSPRPGIIAISATGEAQLDMARMMGASYTLQKPIRPDQLLNAVADLSRGTAKA